MFAGKTAQALKEAEAAAALDKEAALDSVKTECDKAVADAAAERDEYPNMMGRPDSNISSYVQSNFSFLSNALSIIWFT